MKVILSILSVILWSVASTSVGYAQAVTNLAEADNQFAFDLYARLSSDTGNIFFSPYSLSSALSMTYEGARNQTADQMRAVLHIPADDVARRQEVSAFIRRMDYPNKSYELSTANALWTQMAYPFKADYLKLIKNVYYAQARNLDFVNGSEGSRLIINNWVSQHTNNHINDLLSPGSIGPETRLVLTNAIYFKGKWSMAFKRSDTKQAPFWLTPTLSIQTTMMKITGKSFKYMDDEQTQILELPYRGDDLSMLIVLPRTNDIKVIENSISESMLEQWERKMYSWPVNVYIPKFRFGTGYQMKDILEEMGIKNAFDPGFADFAGMANFKPDERLYIDQVYHKAWIDVNEEGTEAAAATAVGMFRASAMMLPREPKIFRADHPFIFLIRDNKTKHILFMGRISDPREK